MDWVIDHLDVKADTWISQSTFLCRHAGLCAFPVLVPCFLTLITTKPIGKNKTPEEAANHFVRICQEVGIPIPSLIVFSGRGLQIKWLLSYNIPRAALPRWNLAQQKICRRLAPYGADANALDAAPSPARPAHDEYAVRTFGQSSLCEF